MPTLQLTQGWKVHKLFLVVGNFNQGAARQGIDMTSPPLQPQHPSIIKALFRHWLEILIATKILHYCKCPRYFLGSNELTIWWRGPFLNYHLQTTSSKPYNIRYANLHIPHIIYKTPPFLNTISCHLYDNSVWWHLQ